MRSSINAIASLDPRDPELDRKLILQNAKLFERIANYAKGKKSVRSFQEGRDRFDNCMDARSIVKDHVPGLSKLADQIVERTNQVRSVKAGDAYFVDLRNFGAAHAEASRREGPGKQLVEKESVGPIMQS